MVSEIIRKIVDTTLERFGRDAEYDDYIAMARELFPDVIEKLAYSCERQGLIKWLQDGMRKAANVDESDPAAPTVQLDLLPGRAAPAYINIGTDNGPRLLRFADAKVKDLDIAIARRREKVGQINARVEDLKAKRNWLLKNQRNANESVSQVCARIAAAPEPVTL